MYGRTKIKPTKNVEVAMRLPEEKPCIGKVCMIDAVIRSKDPIFLQYVLFELVNERTDKRAPMDRVTSRSRYLSRFNVEKALEANAENKHTFRLRIPVHKEPSRNDKFICIKWQLSLQVVVKANEEDKELLAAQVAPVEFEIV
jgi:hypothetical protein